MPPKPWDETAEALATAKDHLAATVVALQAATGDSRGPLKAKRLGLIHQIDEYVRSISRVKFRYHQIHKAKTSGSMFTPVEHYAMSSKLDDFVAETPAEKFTLKQPLKTFGLAEIEKGKRQQKQRLDREARLKRDEEKKIAPYIEGWDTEKRAKKPYQGYTFEDHQLLAVGLLPEARGKVKGIKGERKKVSEKKIMKDLAPRRKRAARKKHVPSSLFEAFKKEAVWGALMGDAEISTRMSDVVE